PGTGFPVPSFSTPDILTVIDFSHKKTAVPVTRSAISGINCDWLVLKGAVSQRHPWIMYDVRLLSFSGNHDRPGLTFHKS
ncbi:hypothetical protein POW83_26725, partial [Escherichia coli]